MNFARVADVQAKGTYRRRDMKSERPTE
jgi:hypothetical protein